MQARIRSLSPEYDKTGQHANYYGKKAKCTFYLFEIEFSNGVKGRTQAKSTIPPYNINELVEYKQNDPTKNFFSVSKISDTFKPSPKPLINNNSNIAIASTSLAMNILNDKGNISLKVKETSVDANGVYTFGKDDLIRFSRKLAEIMIDVQLYLDSK
jgi:hypothetical protein